MSASLSVSMEEHLRVVDLLDGRLKKANAEIERLRETLAAMERGYKSFRDTAEAEYARLNAEIDRRGTEEGRLRGLLREAHLALSFMPDPTRKLLDLRYRVREALGE